MSSKEPLIERLDTLLARLILEGREEDSIIVSDAMIAFRKMAGQLSEGAGIIIRLKRYTATLKGALDDMADAVKLLKKEDS